MNRSNQERESWGAVESFESVAAALQVTAAVRAATSGARRLRQ
jgi:hypothetical protein